MVYTKSSIAHSDPAPLFGTNLSENAFVSDSPVLTQQARGQIWNKEGTSQIEFRSNFLCLDYDILSQDMNEMSECLKSQKSEEFFKIPAINKLIDHLWKQAETPLMIFFAFYSAFIIALSVYLTFEDRSLAYEITLLATSALLIANELCQLVNLKMDYLTDAWNWLDLAQLFLTAAFLIARIAENDNELARAWISTFIIVLGYLRWISLLKIFGPTRNLIQVVVTVVKDMVSFITIIALIIVGFSVIFLVFNREAGYGDYLYEAYNVMYGPVDIDDGAAWPFSQKLIMAVLAFFLNVVLLNLLISIMGDSYGQVLEMREKTDSLTRLEMISEAAVYRKFLKQKHQTKRGYLVYCLPVELGEDESSQNSELESVIKTMKKLIQKNNEESKKEIQTLKDKVQENNLRLEASMKKEISSMKTEIFTYLQNEFSKLNSK
jgi:gas vesicle protein